MRYSSKILKLGWIITSYRYEMICCLATSLGWLMLCKLWLELNLATCANTQSFQSELKPCLQSVSSAGKNSACNRSCEAREHNWVCDWCKAQENEACRRNNLWRGKVNHTITRAKWRKKKGGKKGLQLLLPRGRYLFFGSFIPRFNKVIGKARLRLNLL